MPLTPTALAAMIDHTLLSPDATPAQIATLCHEANQHQFAAVCIRPDPALLQVAQATLAPSVKLAVVIGFPPHKASRADEVAHPSVGLVPWETQQAEIQRALGDGAHELDVVLPVSWWTQELIAPVQSRLAAWRQTAPQAVIKVILETDLLTLPQVSSVVALCAAQGMDCVKTSTGMVSDPEPWTAKIEKIAAMDAAIQGQEQSAKPVFIKVSGGVRTLAEVQPLLRFPHVRRIGTSSGLALVSG
jgi:deoxyribose-phosphate aldolase